MFLRRCVEWYSMEGESGDDEVDLVGQIYENGKKRAFLQL